MKKSVALLSMMLMAGHLIASGPTSTLYLTSSPGQPGMPYGNFRVLGGTTTALASSQHFPNESAIAAYGGRVYCAQNPEVGNLGSVYDADFNYVSSLTTSIFFPISGARIFDGTTDGRFNYGIDDNTGNVYRFDLTWGGSPTLLFQAAGSRPIGITYDSANGSLWTSDFSDGTVRDYSMNGTLLFSFSSGNSQNMALAYDPADNSLWMLTQWLTGTFAQYNTAGSRVQTMNLEVPGSDILGAEFMMVPEPSTLTVAAGLWCLMLWRLRQKKAQFGRDAARLPLEGELARMGVRP